MGWMWGRIRGWRRRRSINSDRNVRLIERCIC
jgi:hypothetical protein